MTGVSGCQFLKLRDTDEFFIDADNQKNFTTRGDAKQYDQKAGHMLREVVGIGANCSGKDVVAMYSSNQASPFLVIIDNDQVSNGYARTGGVWSSSPL